MGADDRPLRHELLRAAPELVEVVAQLVWVVARERRVGTAEADRAGLHPLLLDAPLAPAEAASFQRGLDALLRERASQERGVYMREVRDAQGTRRELAVPTAPDAWTGAETMVGPFPDEVAAEAWRAERVRPPLVGDVLVQGGRAYVDVFSGEGGVDASGSDVDTPDGPG